MNNIFIYTKKKHLAMGKEMKHMKTFEGLFSFRKNKKEDIESTEEVVEDVVEDVNTSIMIDKEHYEESQFKQKKFHTYLVPNEGDKMYYIGDIREFSTGGVISYLNLDRTSPMPKNVSGLREVNEEELAIVNKELGRRYLSARLMDDDILFRDKFKKDYGVIL